MTDKIMHGTHNRGERHGHSKLTIRIVRAIRASADSYSVLAKRHGITSGHVSDIKNGYRWGWLAD